MVLILIVAACVSGWNYSLCALEMMIGSVKLSCLGSVLKVLSGIMRFLLLTIVFGVVLGRIV